MIEDNISTVISFFSLSSTWRRLLLFGLLACSVAAAVLTRRPRPLSHKEPRLRAKLPLLTSTTLQEQSQRRLHRSC